MGEHRPPRRAHGERGRVGKGADPWEEAEARMLVFIPQMEISLLFLLLIKAIPVHLSKFFTLAIYETESGSPP